MQANMCIVTAILKIGLTEQTYDIFLPPAEALLSVGGSAICSCEVYSTVVNYKSQFFLVLRVPVQKCVVCPPLISVLQVSQRHRQSLGNKEDSDVDCNPE